MSNFGYNNSRKANEWAQKRKERLGRAKILKEKRMKESSQQQYGCKC